MARSTQHDPHVRRPRSSIPALCLALLCGVATGCDGCGGGAGDVRDAAADAGPAGDGGAGVGFGDLCDDDGQCSSGVCAPVAGNLSVCTLPCAPGTAASACPGGVNWRCAVRGEGPGECRCEADAEGEVCADGRDNDCDGHTDNCRECGALLVGPDDPFHCGGCDQRCRLGASCVDGQCRCPDGGEGEACRATAADPACAVGVDCDDGIDCTEDTCDGTGRCRNTVVPARCAAGEVCDIPGGGCSPGRACAADSGCLDADPCTVAERCDPATRVCHWLPLDGDGDGQAPRVCGGTDCHDDQPQTFVGAVERCDGLDNDCDGEVDAPLRDDACPADRACSGGACRCTGERLDCLGRCVDGQTDADNCGGCGRVCAPGAHCAGGECACAGAASVCPVGCVDLVRDVSNCGGCGRTCDAGSERCEGGACVDIDECSEGLASCPDHSDCVDRAGGYGCACHAGYRALGGGCADIDECVTGANDCAAGACLNTDGGYLCRCPAGFEGDGRSCSDVADCLVQDCASHGSCVELPGSYRCECDFGHAFDGTTCVVSDACQAGLLEGQAWCSNYCATLADDTAHCGECGHACLPTQLCQGGVCACPGGTDYCQGIGCVDLASTDGHCGACGVRCGVEQSCVLGGCECPAGEDPCPGADCVDLRSDTAHCGGCDSACPATQLCAGGQCVCPAGQDYCPGTGCVDLQTDARFCGDCSVACPEQHVCRAGACTCAFGSYCDGVGCIDTQVDSGHCGACGVTCAEGGVCVAGACGCPPGRADCGGVCTDLGTTVNCLVCGDGCAVGALCAAGGCRCEGEPDERPCDGQCVDTTADAQHCGACGNVCAADEVCAAGTCACPDDRPVECGGLCVSLEFDEAHCGACGVPCGSTCGDGRCLGNPVQIIAFGYASCALFEQGDLFCWGRYAGVPGVYPPMRVSALDGLGAVAQLVTNGRYACAVLTDGDGYCWGRGGSGLGGLIGRFPGNPASTIGPDLQLVAPGTEHLCVVRTGGAVECVGRDTHGQRGDGVGSVFPREWSAVVGLAAPDAISSGFRHSCALDAGRVYCWGDNALGQLGRDPALTPMADAPLEVPGLQDVVALDAGDSHNCVRRADESVWCWGDNSSLQLGAEPGVLASHVPLEVVGAGVGSLHVGAGLSCVTDAAGVLRCWGTGDAYQFSSEVLVDRATPTVIAVGSGVRGVSSSWLHTCAIDGAGQVLCWGAGEGAGLGGRPTPAPMFP